MIRTLVLTMVLAIALAVVATASATMQAPTDFILSTSCPPGFEKTGAGVCELRTLYQFYDSLKTAASAARALPCHRTGTDSRRSRSTSAAISSSIRCCRVTAPCPARAAMTPRADCPTDAPRSIGIHGADAGRAAPTLWNVAFLKRFFWDARADSLEAQAAGPIYSPREMGNTPKQLLTSLNGNATYRASVPGSLPGRYRRSHGAAGLHGAHRFRDLAGLPQQPLRPLRPRVRRRALRA